MAPKKAKRSSSKSKQVERESDTEQVQVQEPAQVVQEPAQVVQEPAQVVQEKPAQVVQEPAHEVQQPVREAHEVQHEPAHVVHDEPAAVVHGDDSDEVVELDEGEVESSDTEVANIPLGRRKKGSTDRYFVFSPAAEDNLIQWWKENPFLYDSTHPLSYDKGKKARALQDKAKDIGCTGEYTYNLVNNK